MDKFISLICIWIIINMFPPFIISIRVDETMNWKVLFVQWNFIQLLPYCRVSKLQCQMVACFSLAHWLLTVPCTTDAHTKSLPVLSCHSLQLCYFRYLIEQSWRAWIKIPGCLGTRSESHCSLHTQDFLLVEEEFLLACKSSQQFLSLL